MRSHRSLSRTMPCLVIVLSLLALAGCRARWQHQGRAEARRDLDAGKLRIKTYGRPAPWAERYYALAKKKLGIEHESIAGSVVDEELVERAEAYNACMMEEINRRFGADALSQLRKEALKEYQKEQAAGHTPGH